MEEGREGLREEERKEGGRGRDRGKRNYTSYVSGANDRDIPTG